MATIRYTYSYTNYPESPTATEYSKKLNKRLAAKTGVAYAFYFAVGALLLSIPLVNVIIDKGSDGLAFFLFIAVLALGIWGGLFVNGRINKNLEAKLEEALAYDRARLSKK